MMRRFSILLTGLILICQAGCRVKKSSPADGSNHPGKSLESPEYAICYARGFSIAPSDSGWVLTITGQPDLGLPEYRYRLVSDHLATGGSDEIVVPVKHIAASSTTHVGFLLALHQDNRLAGVTNPGRIYNDSLFIRYRSGSLSNLGRDMAYELEPLIEVNPDLIVQTGFEGQMTGRISKNGMPAPVLNILEWRESHPLGRAEWIKVFGLVTGQLTAADSLFRIIENRYNQLVHTVLNVNNKPLVMTGNNFKGTWYMPGGENFMARLFRDGGMTYPFADTPNRGSLALSFETVLDRFSSAKVWIGVNAVSRTVLLKEDERYRSFSSLRTGRIFSINGKVNQRGANDFWESGVVRPDIILQDIINMAHPGLLQDHELCYFKVLKK
ncbi:MAG: ABC transporter substrate-binding protein [Bacteroidales bacterium]|nr:ABC transporter substrate-binding protein [Bacteroidales bacterium]